MTDRTTSLAARRDLPPDYVRSGVLDLARNVPAQIGLSVAGIGLFFGFLILFGQIVIALRADLTTIGFTLDGTDVFLGLAALLIVVIVVVVLHEAVHGIAFWLFTREPPRFGFRGLYAFAGAPDWHLPRLQYAVVGGAPLVLLSLGGLLLALSLPVGVLPLLILGLTMNAAGAIGDMLVLGWIAFSPRGSLFRDTGDAVERHIQAESAHRQRYPGGQ